MSRPAGREYRKARKRAEWEGLTADVTGSGRIEVTNHSHGNPADHRYVVTLDDVTDEPVACTCPHHTHRNAFCKHMAAVEDAMDDGERAAPSTEDDTETGGCDCENLADLPCWECVKSGHKELPG